MPCGDALCREAARACRITALCWQRYGSPGLKVMKVKPRSVSGPDSAAAVRKLLLVQIDAAVKRLRDGPSPKDSDVHEARKSIKRARAMLRLLRQSLEAGDFSICKVQLRKAGRALSASRDARVIADTFNEVLIKVDIRRDSFHGIELPGDASLSTDSTAARRRAASAARTSLTAARLRLARASLHGKDWEELGAGMRSIYTRGRRLMPAKSKSASAGAMHEWRKQVKGYWYVMEVLMPVHPTQIGRSVRDARRLADLLGEDHDLELLAGKLRAMGASAASPARALLEAIKSRQKQLRRRALKVGAALYAEPPGVMEKRLRRDWQKWIDARLKTSNAPTSLTKTMARRDETRATHR
jgi:CHAD domain-containing protein